jgi:cytochrome c peroxidase
MNKNNILSFLAILLIITTITSCDPPEKPTHITTPYFFNLPSYFPSNYNIPEDNPMTVEGIKLGRYLFYDGRLSGRTHEDSLMSCATCHRQERNFNVGTDHPKFPGGFPFGLSGTPTPHVPMPLVNLVFNYNGYFWNGMIHPSNKDENKCLLEHTLWMGIVAPHEMSGDTNRTKQLISSIDIYPPMFEAAFGSKDVTIERMGKAIAQFIRSIVSYNSKFDRYIRGEEMLTEQELWGYELFITEEGADCFHCHGGAYSPLFTTNLYYNNGKDTIFTGEYEDSRDRYHITHREYDKGAYRAPSLRNVIYNAPYMHDGRFETLDEVLNFYNFDVKLTEYTDVLMHHANQGGVKLTPVEMEALKAFLMTLTDEAILTAEEYSNPF